MGNTLHIVYFIDMKNKIFSNKNNNVSYQKLHNQPKNITSNINSSVNTNTDSNTDSNTDTNTNTSYNSEMDDKYIEQNCLTDEQNLKKWLECVECW